MWQRCRMRRPYARERATLSTAGRPAEGLRCSSQDLDSGAAGFFCDAFVWGFAAGASIGVSPAASEDFAVGASADFSAGAPVSETVGDSIGASPDMAVSSGGAPGPFTVAVLRDVCKAELPASKNRAPVVSMTVGVTKIRRLD